MKLRRESHAGFTLIELLVVMAIIGILSGLIFTSIGAVTKKAKMAKAKVQIKQLEKAFVAYHDEYGEWPKAMTSYDLNPSEGSLTGIELEEKCALMLAGEPTDGDGVTYNDQGISFIQKATIAMSKDGEWSKRGYLDPWGHCYKYIMDFDDNGEIIIQFSNASGDGDKSVTVSGLGVAVWSRGPDGIDALDGDDVTSWKLQ